MQSKGGATMKRINLSVEDSLLTAIEAAAAKAGTTTNLLIINLLEASFCGQKTFDYGAALQTLVSEAKARPAGEFTMADLPSFSQLCVATAENGYLQPSTLRARLGKAFNNAVSQRRVPGVTRATVTREGKEKLKFFARTAVYVKKTKEEKH